MAVQWNALMTPNYAAALGQGIDFANAMSDRRYQRERDVLQDQRQERQDARQERRDTMEEQRYGAETRKAEIAERAARFKQVATVLKQTPAEQRPQRYQQMAPALEQLGWSPEQIQAGGQTLDDASLDAFIGEIEKEELKFYERPDGIYGLDPKTQKVERVAALPMVVGDFILTPDGQQAAAPQAQAPAAPAAAPAGAMGTYRDAIANIESRGSGDDKALGPVTRTGDRAYGRYQVMGANIPQWTREALGREMTPQEFLASPEAQDRVFDHRFGSYVQQYGSPEEAASMWFTGRPLSQGGNRRDQLGTSGSEYVQRFAQNANRPLAGGAGGDTLSDAPSLPGYTARRVKPSKPEAPPSGYRWTADGALEPIRGGPADPATESVKPKAPTDGDKQSVAFAYRTIRANDRLNSVIESGVVKPTTVTTSLFDTDSTGARRLVLRTPEDRRFFQAAKEWLAPVLRKDTGAAVTDAELATYMDIFIPRYEDDEATLRQKAEARQDAMIALVRQGGSLYDRTHGARTFQSQWGPTRRKPPGKGGKRPSLDSILHGGD